MRNAIFPLTVLGALVFPGCVEEKSFEVTGTLPPSQMRQAAAQSDKPRTAPQPTFPSAQRVTTPVPQTYQTPARPQPPTAPASETVASVPAVSAPVNTPPKVTVVPDTALVGKVVSVNASLRFVVLNFPVGRMASVDSQFNLYRQGQKIGSVKITGPQQDDNIIADISDGEAQAGDEVREN